MKKIFVEKAAFGTRITREAFQVRECHEKGGDFHFTVSDRTGCMDAVLVSLDGEVIELLRKRENSVFLVDGVVINCPVEGSAPKKQLKVSAISLATSGDYRANEVYGGITEARKDRLIEQIFTDLGQVKDPELLSLVSHFVTKENLNKLAQLPATISDYGSYVGGALVATSQISGLSIQHAVISTKRSGELYHVPSDFSMLVAASLLSQMAKPMYFDVNNPFEKSKQGVILNYFPMLQSLIVRTVAEKKIQISETKLNTLLNILSVALTRSDIVATSKEALMMSQAVDSYRKMEIFEEGYHHANFGEGDSAKTYVYGEKGNFYYLAPEQEESVAENKPVAENMPVAENKGEEEEEVKITPLSASGGVKS